MDKQKSDPLEEFNKRIEGFDDKLKIREKPSHNIFIVGAPRSGTTLLCQLMTSCLKVGYIDNLIATFWSAPAFGSFLSRKLITDRPFSSDSEFGRTQGIHEPHEFGRFWRERLGYVNMTQKSEAARIDWDSLLKDLDRISSAQGRPVVYKVFQLFWHLSEFHRLRPNTRWILITRDLIANASSLLKVRMKFTGDIKDWTSAIPLKAIEKYNDSSPFHQVLAQTIYINEWIEEEFAKIDYANCCTIRFEEILKNSQSQMIKLAEFCDVKVDSEMIQHIQNSFLPDTKADAVPWRDELLKAASEMDLLTSHHCNL